MQQIQQEIDISQWYDFKQENSQAWDAFGVLAGLLSVIQDVLRGATNALPSPSARSGVLICSLMNASVQRSQIKTPFQLRWKGVCAQDWIRTSTPFPALPPQGSASTNFATWARGMTNLCKNQDMKKWTDNF